MESKLQGKGGLASLAPQGDKDPKMKARRQEAGMMDTSDPLFSLIMGMRGDGEKVKGLSDKFRVYFDGLDEAGKTKALTGRIDVPNAPKLHEELQAVAKKYAAADEKLLKDYGATDLLALRNYGAWGTHELMSKLSAVGWATESGRKPQDSEKRALDKGEIDPALLSELEKAAPEAQAWIDGIFRNVVDYKNFFNQKAKELGIPRTAGPSGTTLRVMQSAVKLGIGDMTGVRFAVMGALMGDPDHHSYHEIATAAAEWVPFRIDPANPGAIYRDVPPLSGEDECRAAGGGKFPDEE
jgi:hypothetical protein